MKKIRARSTFDKKYIGEFKHDFKYGLGIMEFSNGDTYQGEYINDKRHGFGKYTYLSVGHDCLVYFGQFSQDTMNGEGKMVFKDGTVFEGNFKNSKMHDEDAMLKYPNGDVYTGGIAHNQKHSKDGEYIYSSSNYSGADLVYKGEFKGDQRVGKGTVHFSTPSIIVNAKIEEDTQSQERIRSKATASVEFVDEKMIYEGEVSGEAIHGTGVLKHLDTGNEFRGTFMNNKKH
mmetsp:Transcript_27452/g.27331  ORF Transcript_27452/g.27331 Transcript_27452/m.27331 type:complete len:231 (+) Transcript_27452:404-1096(+)